MKFDVIRYIGELRDDKPEGLGILYAANNDKYVGYFSAGEPNGVGALVTQTKESYGDFLEWNEHGHCTVLDMDRDSLFKG